MIEGQSEQSGFGFLAVLALLPHVEGESSQDGEDGGGRLAGRRHFHDALHLFDGGGGGGGHRRVFQRDVGGVLR